MLRKDDGDILSDDMVADLKKHAVTIDSCLKAQSLKEKMIEHVTLKDNYRTELQDMATSMVHNITTLITALSNFNSVLPVEPDDFTYDSQEMILGSGSDGDGDDSNGPGDSGDERGAGRQPNKKRKRLVEEDEAAVPEGGSSSSSAAIPVATAVPQTMLGGLFRRSSPARK